MPAARPGRRAAAVPARAARTTRRWRGRAVRRWNERSLRRLHGSGVGRTAAAVADRCLRLAVECLLQRSEEHTSELQSLMRISYAVFCLKKKKINQNSTTEVSRTHT